MVKETEINNDEIIIAPRMTLFGVKEISFKNDDGEINGVYLYWVYPEGSVPGVKGRGCAIQYIPDGKESDWIPGADYEPNVIFTINKGKPAAKITGYKLCK